MQCLAKCREDVCEALSLQTDDVDLSMGMSGDFEQAVSTCPVLRLFDQLCRIHCGQACIDTGFCIFVVII